MISIRKGEDSGPFSIIRVGSVASTGARRRGVDVEHRVGIDHGAKYDPIEPGVIDRGGAINTIVPRNTTSKNACGHAVSGFLAEVEKADLEGLNAKYPDAFARECHITAGPCLAGFTESGYGGGA